MFMEVPLRSCTNVREVLEMSDIIESTQFRDLPALWRDQMILPIYFHCGPIGSGEYYVYYEPWSRGKYALQTTMPG